MLRIAKYYRFLGVSAVFIGIFALLGPLVNAQSEYNETISVLQTLHKDEMQAMHNYQAYAHKAVSQKYPNIGICPCPQFQSELSNLRCRARNISATTAEGCQHSQKPEIRHRRGIARNRQKIPSAA